MDPILDMLRSNNPISTKQARRRRQRANARARKQNSNGKMVVYNPNQSSSVASAYDRRTKIGQPKVDYSRYQKDGRVRFSHREYLADLSSSVVGDTVFNVVSFPINPGMFQTFPWLSTQALGFESYRFLELSFEYETYSPTSIGGSVMLAVDYDAADSTPMSKQQMMSYNGAVRSAAWNFCEFNAAATDLRKLGDQHYIRYGNLAANLDIKTYDIGNLFAASQNVAATGFGELYVRYVVELITPQVGFNTIAQAISSYIVANGSITRTNCFGDLPEILGGLPVQISGEVLTFNRPGVFVITGAWTGTVITGDAPVVTADLAGLGVALGTTFTFSYDIGLVNSAATAANFVMYVTVVSQGGNLTFNFSGKCTTLTALALTGTIYDVSLLQ